MAGNPRAVRVVGGAMRRNPVSVADTDWQASLLLTLFNQIGKVVFFKLCYFALMTACHVWTNHEAAYSQKFIHIIRIKKEFDN